MASYTLHSAIKDDGDNFQIVPSTRKIVVPASHKVIGTVGSHISEEITFQCPKTIDGHDVAGCSHHYVSIISADGVYSEYHMSFITTDEDNMYLAWTITRDITTKAGNITFAVHFEDRATDGKTVLYSWSTTECSECQILPTVRPTSSSNSNIPDGYVKVEGSINITENGIYDISKYAYATINVQTSADGDSGDSGEDVIPTEKLDAPTISISENTLNITDNSGKATSYDIYIDDVKMTNVNTTSVDLATVVPTYGTYMVNVRAKADGYIESQSNFVSYTYAYDAPVISLVGSNLYIEDVGGEAVSYDILVGMSTKTNTNATNYDLTQLITEEGTHRINVKAKTANGVLSNLSNTVEYVIKYEVDADYNGTTWRFKNDITNGEIFDYVEANIASDRDTLPITLGFTCSLFGDDTNCSTISLEPQGTILNTSHIDVYCYVSSFDPHLIGRGNNDKTSLCNFTDENGEPYTITLTGQPSATALAFLNEFAVMLEGNYSFGDVYLFRDDITTAEVKAFVDEMDYESTTTTTGIEKRIVRISVPFYTDSNFQDRFSTQFNKVELAYWIKNGEATNCGIYGIDENNTSAFISAYSNGTISCGIRVVTVPAATLTSDAVIFLDAFATKYYEVSGGNDDDGTSYNGVIPAGEYRAKYGGDYYNVPYSEVPTLDISSSGVWFEYAGENYSYLGAEIMEDEPDVSSYIDLYADSLDTSIYQDETILIGSDVPVTEEEYNAFMYYFAPQ